MNAEPSKLTIAILKWTNGLVLLAESLRLALEKEGPFFDSNPLLHYLRAALAW